MDNFQVHDKAEPAAHTEESKIHSSLYDSAVKGLSEPGAVLKNSEMKNGAVNLGVKELEFGNPYGTSVGCGGSDKPSHSYPNSARALDGGVGPTPDERVDRAQPIGPVGEALAQGIQRGEAIPPGQGGKFSTPLEGKVGIGIPAPMFPEYKGSPIPAVDRPLIGMPFSAESKQLHSY